MNNDLYENFSYEEQFELYMADVMHDEMMIEKSEKEETTDDDTEES